jgi:hypothetical protein
MIVDGEPPMPEVGSVLTEVGVRVIGEVAPAQPGSRDEVVEDRAAAPHHVVYRLTGRADHARDTYIGGVKPGGHHAGTEFALTVGATRYQVSTGGHPADVTAGSRVVVTGRLELVGGYEWDAFDLSDTRADWLVKAAKPAIWAGRGDALIDLHPLIAR